MTAFVVIDVDIHDSAGFAAYAQAVPAVIARHGGQPLLRRRPAEVLEGDWKPASLVIIAFPTRGDALRFWNSDDLAAIAGTRRRSATARIVLAEEPAASL
jgi:uncharacterized protein (DUF1330 family)